MVERLEKIRSGKIFIRFNKEVIDGFGKVSFRGMVGIELDCGGSRSD